MMKQLKICALLVLLLFLAGSGVGSAREGVWALQFEMWATGGDHRLRQPMGIICDGADRRYFVADAGSGALASFDENGKFISTLKGGGEFTTAIALARTTSEKLWVVNRAGNQLFYIDPRGRDARRFSPVDTVGRPVLAGRIELGPGNELYLLDRLQGHILQLDDNLQVVRTFQGPSGGRGFTDFKLRQGGLWALDGLAGTVHVFSLAGRVERTIVLEKNRLQFPVSLEVDGGGRLYLLDRHAGRIGVFDPQGRFQYAFLSRGKGRGELWYPAQIRFDWQGRLCVVDEGNGKVEVYGRH